MITRDEILMGRDNQYPLTPELEENLRKLIKSLNLFRLLYGKPMIVSSGYRPGTFNLNTPGSAKKSNHVVCLACDFKDSDGLLDKYCMDNLYILEQCGLYLESPQHTPGWCHLQCVAPKSGNRVFLP